MQCGRNVEVGEVSCAGLCAFRWLLQMRSGRVLKKWHIRAVFIVFKMKRAQMCRFVRIRYVSSRAVIYGRKIHVIGPRFWPWDVVIGNWYVTGRPPYCVNMQDSNLFLIEKVTSVPNCMGHIIRNT